VKKAEVRAEHLLQEQSVIARPVPVEDIARILGARLLFEPLNDELSGLLYREGGVATIGVNSAHPTSRQRFTVAHEIGHLLLHEGKPMFVDKLVRVDLRDSNSAAGTLKEEREANAFAAALLMPQAMILESLQRVRGLAGDAMVQSLADRFQVSTQAMEYRLTNLGLVVVVPR
jgi:Zn-dependent peptidase ImmA (M78 family)